MSSDLLLPLRPCRSKRLKPTVDEYLSALESGFTGPSVRSKWAPVNLAVDEKSVVDELRELLEPAGIYAGYYPPPGAEGLASMGMRPDHPPPCDVNQTRCEREVRV